MTRREREITDPNKILDILNESKIIHLGLVDEGMPYIVPMNYGYTMEDGKLALYLHCAVKGYKLDVIQKSPVCCFEMECGVRMFEGKVPCQYGTVYSSLMGRGTVSVIEDSEEKIKAMQIFMKTQTGKDFEFTEKLLSIVTLLKIDVSEYTAKARPLPEALRD